MKWESVLLIFKTMYISMSMLRKQSVDVWSLIHKYNSGAGPVNDEFREQAMKLLETISNDIKAYYEATEDLVHNFPYVKEHGADLYEAYKDTGWMMFEDEMEDNSETEPSIKGDFQPNFMQAVKQL